jgi:hypothetical protein
MDLFTIPTLTFGVLHCFFVIGHDRLRSCTARLREIPCGWGDSNCDKPGLQTAALILAIRPRREVWRRCGFGREKHRKSANAHGLSQSVAERCGGALGWEVAAATCWTRDNPEGAASQTAEVCILGLLPRGPDSSGTREGHASGSAYSSSPLWNRKQDSMPGETRRPAPSVCSGSVDSRAAVFQTARRFLL